MENIPFLEAVHYARNDFAKGEFLIVMDSEDRSNEGYLVVSAQHMTIEKMIFLIRHTSGFVCCAMTPRRLSELELPLMCPPGDPFNNAFCITTDVAEGTTTGISARDRCKTVQALSNYSITDPAKFYRPGHIVPVRSAIGGVLERAGHTEAAIDLCILSNCYPCGVLSALVNDYGDMKSRADCVEFGKKFWIRIITIEQLIKYRTFEAEEALAFEAGLRD